MSAMVLVIIWMSLFLPVKSKECNPGCVGEGEFDEKGVCREGCKPGYFGLYCQNECVAYCGGTGSQCNRYTGHCSEGCDPGFYGDMCLSVCSYNCAENESCDSAGHCDDGCKAGYSGVSCTEVCSNATFGKNCQHQCACKNNLQCDRVIGHCPNYQCADGRTDIICYRVLPKLLHPPTILSKSCNNITLVWRAFDVNIDSGFGPVGQYNWPSQPIGQTGTTQ
ncbi:hypothetical protein Btru_040345 [Bulinus truncatus]|nr:hypothetical protein Btru_040345 [Bulinus truncatus]